MSTTSTRLPSGAPTGNPPSSSSASQPTRPPVTIHPTAHLDPGAYVRGSHAITLGPGVLIHPRAQLISLHGPLIIGDGVVIGEKCVVGGPVSNPTLAPDSKESLEGVVEGNGSGEGDEDPLKTLVESNSLLMPYASIHAGASIGEACTVESHATLTKTTQLGAHSKVCAGAFVDGIVGDWEVVMGGGATRRRRGGRDLEVVEKARLNAVERDREVTVEILRKAARAPVLKKR